MDILKATLLFAFLIVLSWSLDCKKDGSVYEVTSQNFDEISKYTQDNDGVLAIFYYGYTDLISSFYIEYQKAAQTLFMEGDRIYFAKSSWNPGLSMNNPPCIYIFLHQMKEWNLEFLMKKKELLKIL